MFKKIEKKLNAVEETISVILFLAVVTVVVWSVIARYLLQIPFIMGEELARYLMIYCVFFGTSIGVRRNAHIGVEVLVQNLKGNLQKSVMLVSKAFTFLMFVVLSALSLLMLRVLIESGQMTTTTSIPTYIVFSCIPINMLLSSFHSFINLLDQWKGIREVSPS